MKTKIYLTSAIAMGFVAPVMAEPTNTENSFPSNGLMAEDTTYTNAATSTNMAGVYENEVNAVAEYENILYQIGVGQYLPAGGESVISCDQPGSFCPGVSGDVTYNANSAQGLSSCSTATNGDYTLSDGTGSSINTCYANGNATCSTRNPYLYGHATNVAYGNSNNGSASCKTYYGDPSTCVLDNSNACEITGLTCESGYTSTTYSAWAQANMALLAQNLANGVTCSPSEVGGCNNGELAAGEGKTIFDEPINGFNGLTYIMACSDISADANNVNTMLTSKDSMTQGQITGKYCWLRTSKIDNINVRNSQWVFYSEHASAQECAEECAFAVNIPNPENYMTASIMSMANERFCAANAITINWTDADSEDISANNAGSTFYGGNVRTPVKATTKPGQRFKGWRFVAPTPVQVGE